MKIHYISFLLFLCSLCIYSQNIPETEDAGDIWVEIAYSNGSRYSFVQEYQLQVLQYDTELSLGIEFPVKNTPLSFAATFGILLNPPPASGEYFSFRGDWGSSLGFEANIYPSLARSRMNFGLIANFRFLRYWHTSVYFMTPEIGVHLQFPILDRKSKRSFALDGNVYIINQFRRDTELSLRNGLAVVLRL